MTRQSIDGILDVLRKIFQINGSLSIELFN